MGVKLRVLGILGSKLVRTGCENPNSDGPVTVWIHLNVVITNLVIVSRVKVG